jgi:hypothetical protein
VNDFQEFLFAKFLEWERLQPKRRSSYSAFARYLSDNSLNITVSQALIEGWVNNRFKPGPKYAPVLAEKLGPEVYDYLDIPKPDPLLIYIQSNWANLSPELQQNIHDEIALYLTKRQGDNLEPDPAKS